MREEDLVTPEWASGHVQCEKHFGVDIPELPGLSCARCNKRWYYHGWLTCGGSAGGFVLHRTDPAVNLQPGQTVEEVRRGYVQREDGSWHKEEARVVFKFVGKPTLSWPLLCHCGGSFSTETEERYDSRRCGSCGAVYSLERCRDPGRAPTKPEEPPEYTCAPGCDPANPCMSEEEYEKLAKLLDADTDVIGKRKFVCRARHHLVVEAALAKLSAAGGVSDPVAKVKSPPVPGVRWNGRSAR